MIGSPPASNDEAEGDIKAAFARLLASAGPSMRAMSYLSEMVDEAARASGLDAWQLERLHDLSWAYAFDEMTDCELEERVAEIRALRAKV